MDCSSRNCAVHIENNMTVFWSLDAKTTPIMILEGLSGDTFEHEWMHVQLLKWGKQVKPSEDSKRTISNCCCWRWEVLNCEGTGVVQGSHKLVCHRKKEVDMTWREEAEERVIRVLLGEKEWMWEAVVANCLWRAMLVQTYFKFHEHWQRLEVVHEMILSVPILPLRNSHSKQWFFLCLLSRKISKWEVASLAFKLNKYQILKITVVMRF